MGAPNGNTNALKNGSRALYRLILGELPNQFRRIKQNTRRYRRDLEAAVTDRHGEVSIAAAHLIDAAAGWECHGGICRWILINRIAKLADADLIKCSAEVAKAKENRNRMIKQLQIDAPSEPPVDFIAMFQDPASPETDDNVSSTDEPSTEPDACVADAQDASEDPSPTEDDQ